MKTLEQGLTQVISAAIIAIMLTICLRSKHTAVSVVSGRQTYRIHPGWYVFCVVGGLFLTGIFAYASATTIPENKRILGWFSVTSALVFAFTALAFRAASVTVDETTLTSRTFFSERSVLLKDIASCQVIGLVVEIKLRPDPTTQKAPRGLNFLASFRGLGELLATLRARAGLPAA